MTMFRSVRFQFVSMIGDASLFDPHIFVQTCKESWDHNSWRTITGTKPRDSPPECGGGGHPPLYPFQDKVQEPHGKIHLVVFRSDTLHCERLY